MIYTKTLNIYTNLTYASGVSYVKLLYYHNMWQIDIYYALYMYLLCTIATLLPKYRMVVGMKITLARRCKFAYNHIIIFE